MAGEWRSSTWGDEVCLEYGKALRGYSQTHGKYRVFGSNGPIGWTNDALTQGPGVILGRKGAYRGVEYCRDPFWVIDTAFVVWRLDRLGRSLPDLVQIVADLERQGVGFESLTEKIETSSAAGKLVFHVFAALAEFERGLIRERTQAGLAAARARGRAGGRKRKLDAKQIRQIKVLLRDPNTSVAEVARDYGVSRTTIYKYCGVVPPSELIEGTT